MRPRQAIIKKTNKELALCFVSCAEYSCTSCQREKPKRDKLSEDKANVEAIVSSLIGAIPDTGKTLEEYRNERLKKYEKDYID